MKTAAKIPGDLDFSNLPIFADLTAAEQQTILSSSVERKFLAGAHIFYQDDPAVTLYLLLQGKVKISQCTPEGQQVILHILTAGQVFGMGAFSKGLLYPGDALVLEDSRILAWEHQTLVDLAKNCPQLTINALGWLAGRVHDLQERLRELTTERVERRLARLLLRLVRQAGRKVKNGVLIDMAISRQDLAEMCGTTLYTVSRILSQWERAGIVDAGRERVLVRIPHGLVTIAEDLPSEAGTDSNPADSAK
jgi:CRP-like cAMP-binding protein